MAFWHRSVRRRQDDFLAGVAQLREWLAGAEAIFIGAGAGLSTAAGFDYAGPRFERYFGDFARRYGFRDMYAGGFYPFGEPEIYWAWWSRAIYVNRYVAPPRPVYEELLSLVAGRDYFVLTTNVDHQFQRAGFDKTRLFYTQGDYGLLQSVNPAIQKTYDNAHWVQAMIEAQGFVRNDEGIYVPPEQGHLEMRIPTELIPVCPDDGSEMTTNLRVDDGFVQDEGWYAAQRRCAEFRARQQGRRVLYLELGVGLNTPGIIKFPFWEAVREGHQNRYVTIDAARSICPDDIAERSLCLQADIGDVLDALQKG